MDQDFLPALPIGDWFAALVTWVSDNLGGLLSLIGFVLDDLLYEHLSDLLTAIPPLIMALALGLLGFFVRGWKFGLGSLIGMLAIQAMRWWPESMDTLALVLIAAFFATIFAIPIGIAAARNSQVSGVVRPIMDFMQTMPAFVYLIPTLFFFGIGATPGIVATIIFAMAPGVRLTELGIRQVDPEMVEAGHAFGAPPKQILFRIQIPLAMPTIMAGINQVIMLSLSMVVIAGIVGAGGLGGAVYSGITRLDIAKGFSAGVGVVILAVYLDRLTAALGSRSAVAKATKKTAPAH
ncbi:MAG: ABC transporter permease subunit [Microlunatus sp.]|nr:ABC transporter permease subunit [Microlunatus sp.]MDN5770243.1 ABC transporter permease subunit [Microlunatus sp.]